MALGRGRRDPLQGRGVGVDARGRPAAAGVDRSAGARPRLRGACAARPDPVAARADADRLPLRPRRERDRDPASTNRSGWTHVLDYRSVLLLMEPDPRAARSRRVERVAPSSTRRAPGGGLSAEGNGGSAPRWGRSLAAEPIDVGVLLASRADAARRSSWRSPVAIYRWSSSRFSTRSASARSREARLPPTVRGPGRTIRRRRAPEAARVGRTPRDASRPCSSTLLARPERTRPRRRSRAADPIRARRRRRRCSRPHDSHPCRTRRRFGSTAAAVERAAETLGLGGTRVRAGPPLPIPRLVDSSRRPRADALLWFDHASSPCSGSSCSRLLLAGRCGRLRGLAGAPIPELSSFTSVAQSSAAADSAAVSI